MPNVAATPLRVAPPERAPGSVPSSCYLCHSERVSLRFPGLASAAPTGVEAYRCTSFGHGNHPPIWGCDSCGMLFQWPMRSGRELVEAYRSVEDPLYVEEKENRYRTFRRVLRSLGEPKWRTLLDVGAYCGYFLDVAREGGFRPEGLELSRWAAKQARGLGLTIHEETLEERAASGAHYDVVTLWDVIEHFADPRAELEAAFKLVKPGGQLYLSTIDAGSLFARVMGRKWPWLMDMHLFYFTRSTLLALVEEVGFRVTEVCDYTHIVSADYLARKVAASLPFTAPVCNLLRRVVPERLSVPINLGDNMLMVATRPI